MTYNLSIERLDEIETDPDAAKAALARVHIAGHDLRAAIGRPSHDAAQAAMIGALIGLYEADPGEMELTAGSMTDALNAMDRLGMLATYDDGKLIKHCPVPFPKQEDFGVTPEMWQYDDGDEPPAPIGAYLAAMSKCAAAQADQPNGIPLYKLQTNDDWLVTPDEIRAALAAHAAPRRPGPSPVTEPDYFWWPYWLRFLERAADHGGFRVH